MNPFSYDDYKKLVLEKIREFPSGGHGVFKKIADSLRIPPSTLTLVFRGDRNLTAEQAIELCDFFGFGPGETEFFMLLVERSRAGNTRLRRYVDQRIDLARAKAEELINRIPKDKVLAEQEKQEYYSEWYYSAIRLLCSLPGPHTAPSIAAELGLPLSRVQDALAFLRRAGLVEERGASLRKTPGTTHIGAHDPLVYRHHQNWRGRSLQRLQEFPELTESELCVSIPCSTSETALRKIRKTLSEAVVKVIDEIDAGKEERLAWINVDLFELRKKPH